MRNEQFFNNAISMIYDFLDLVTEDIQEEEELERQIFSPFIFGMLSGMGIDLKIKQEEVGGVMLWCLHEVFDYSQESTIALFEDLIKSIQEEYHPTRNFIIHRGIDGYYQYKDGDKKSLYENIEEIVELIYEETMKEIQENTISRNSKVIYDIEAPSPDRKWCCYFVDEDGLGMMYFLPMSPDGKEVIGVSDSLLIYQNIYPSIKQCKEVLIVWNQKSTRAAFIVDDEIWGMVDLVSKRKLNAERRNNCILPIPYEFLEYGIPKNVGTELKLEVKRFN